MIALIQRVSSASVTVDGQIIAAIDRGLLALIGVRPDDVDDDARRLLDRLLKYRVFADEAGKMNVNLRDIDGSLLLVPQFTLAADTRHGLRPGFSTAAPPDVARRLFDTLLVIAKAQHARVASGKFGADMQVALVNDGPVTFWLES